jgi:hypothetical protein
LKSRQGVDEIKKEELKQQAKELLKSEVTRIIDMLDFDKITIDIKAMSLDKAEAVNLRSKL